MKDYLKCSLSCEEIDLINGIIWVAAKCYKTRKYNQNKRRFVSIDEVELSVEDEYDFFGVQTRGGFDFIKPMTELEKIDVVDYVDSILSELSLNKFKIALTFDEKLMIFFFIFKHYSEKKVAYLLQIKMRRVKYLKESYRLKKKRYLGGMENV